MGAFWVIEENGTAVGLTELRVNVMEPMPVLEAADALPEPECEDAPDAALEAAEDAEDPEAAADEEEAPLAAAEVVVPSRAWCLMPAGPWAAAMTGRARAETRVKRMAAGSVRTVRSEGLHAEGTARGGYNWRRGRRKRGGG